MKNLIQLPAEFDYNLLLYALKDYKKSRDKIRGLVKDKDIDRIYRINRIILKKSAVRH